MIAEDEGIIAITLKKKLEIWGYDVCTITKTGRDTVTSALRHLPDLLIIDIFLEDDIDGVDAIREIHDKRFIPVIYITASTDSMTLQKARLTEMVKFITKPYNDRELIDAIALAS
jgi:CheY-like chemotaxis protein